MGAENACLFLQSVHTQKNCRYFKFEVRSSVVQNVYDCIYIRKSILIRKKYKHNHNNMIVTSGGRPIIFNLGQSNFVWPGVHIFTWTAIYYRYSIIKRAIFDTNEEMTIKSHENKTLKSAPVSEEKDNQKVCQPKTLRAC